MEILHNFLVNVRGNLIFFQTEINFQKDVDVIHSNWIDFLARNFFNVSGTSKRNVMKMSYYLLVILNQK